MADAEIGKLRRIVLADGNIARHVGHVVVHAGIPLQRHHRIEIADRCERVRNTAHAGCGERPGRGRQRPIDGGRRPAENAADPDRELPAQYRCCKCIGRREDHQVALRIQVEVDIDGRGNAADFDFLGRRGAAEAAMVV
jgi:hypothetical protein